MSEVGKTMTLICCHGHEFSDCDYCKAVAKFDAWVASQDEEIQELSLLDQIEAYAKVKQ